MADVKNVSVQPDGGKKKKLSLKKNVKPADFGGPEKPQTAFFLFGNEVRPAITEKIRANLKEGEKFNVAMVARQIGADWKEVSAEKKAEYQKIADEQKASFEAETEKWKQSKQYREFLKVNALHKKKQADKKNVIEAKASGMPQRPMAGYMMFANDVRDEVRKELEAKGEKFDVRKSGAITKQKYEALSEEKKNVYNEKYLVAKTKYAADYAAWLETEAGKKYEKAKATNEKRKRENQKVGKKAKRAKKDPEAADADDDEDEEDDEDIELSDPDSSVEQEAGGEEEDEEVPDE